ncbi:Uncharacterized protein APZ42_023513 [Daphnia magna]|uniref:Secreted protein n=1 Tax=Daphnia magna TaxID=35525 RepID=A0A164UW52_9CRUS|nr:Uncharacterized protein APZ42_023513 [Daphnia magna]
MRMLLFLLPSSVLIVDVSVSCHPGWQDTPKKQQYLMVFFMKTKQNKNCPLPLVLKFCFQLKNRKLIVAVESFISISFAWPATNCYPKDVHHFEGNVLSFDCPSSPV